MVIGTALAIGLGAAAIAGSTAVSAIGASKAGKAQAAAADRAMGVERANFLDGLKLIQPQIRAGDRAREAMLFEMGLGPRPTFTPEGSENALSVSTIPGGFTPGDGSGYDPYSPGWDPENNVGGGAGGSRGPDRYGVGGNEFATREGADNYLSQMLAKRNAGGTEYQGFRATPGYQFRVGEGQKAIERSAAARGLQMSGSTMKDLTRFGQGIGSQEYGNFYNRLAGLAGAGQTASGQGFAGFQNQGNVLADLQLQKGNARASSYIGVGNALNSGIGNMLSLGGMFGGGGKAGGGSFLKGF